MVGEVDCWDLDSSGVVLTLAEEASLGRASPIRLCNWHGHCCLLITQQHNQNHIFPFLPACKSQVEQVLMTEFSYWVMVMVWLLLLRSTPQPRRCGLYRDSAIINSSRNGLLAVLSTRGLSSEGCMYARFAKPLTLFVSTDTPVSFFVAVIYETFLTFPSNPRSFGANSKGR